MGWGYAKSKGGMLLEEGQSLAYGYEGGDIYMSYYEKPRPYVKPMFTA